MKIDIGRQRAYRLDSLSLLAGDGVDLSLDPKTLRRLKVAMEAAKCRLSDEPFAIVREEYIDGRNHLELEILRVDYERMIGRLIDKTAACLHQALSDAGTSPRDINKIMLVSAAAIAARQYGGLAGLNDTLSDLLFYLED